MSAPNMATITASIERSLQNCSLNNHQSSSSSSSNDSNNSAGMVRATFVDGRSSTSDSTENHDLPNILELNSEVRLPYFWEQCLDLKTGEVYYINWRTGMKSQEDPRTNSEMTMKDGLLCSEEEDDESSYDSEGSSTEESSPSTSREQCQYYSYNPPPPPPPPPPTTGHQSESNGNPQPSQVLVVAGCKVCFMYFMVPKQVEDCPKCFGQLLHFDRSENGSQ